MANIFGYNQLFSTEPELWLIDGYIGLASDGYTVLSGSVLPKEVLSLRHDGTGKFTLLLQHCWFALQTPVIVPVSPTGDTPALPMVTILSSNIGAAGTVDGQQGVSFEVSSAGSASNMGAHGGFYILLLLKRSSA